MAADGLLGNIGCGCDSFDTGIVEALGNKLEGSSVEDLLMFNG